MLVSWPHFYQLVEQEDELGGDLRCAFFVTFDADFVVGDRIYQLFYDSGLLLVGFSGC